MPRTPNKILINGNGINGMAYLLQMHLQSAKIISDEILEVGGGIANNKLLKEDADLHLAEQERICANLDKAMLTAIVDQDALNEKRRKWWDTKL